MIAAERIAEVMGLRQPVRSLTELSDAVNRGLPKSTLRHCVQRVVASPQERRRLMSRIVPEATYKRRRTHLKPEESARTERVARVIATAEYVWDEPAEARRFLTTPHPELNGQVPLELALSELGARQVEEVLWKLAYGLPV